MITITITNIIILFFVTVKKSSALPVLLPSFLLPVGIIFLSHQPAVTNI